MSLTQKPGRSCRRPITNEVGSKMPGERPMTTATGATPGSDPTFPCDQALQIARLDAEKVYRDLFRFRIEIVLEAGGWHINYILKNPQMNGGGPHYIIDATSGAIVSKMYYQ